MVRMPEGASPPVAFAASELARYVSDLRGMHVVVRPESQLAGQFRLMLGTDKSAPVSATTDVSSGFCIDSGGGGVTLTGASPRAVLDAVYALLTGWGCRWSPHGPDDESVPALTTLPLPEKRIHATPRFSVTGYAADLMTWHPSEPALYRDRIAEDRVLIDWMGKTGANRFLYIRHPVDDVITVPELQDELDRRGIGVEVGGHVIPALVPRELFGAHPEYFPCGADGARTSNGNMCTSVAGALETARRSAMTWIEEHPGAAAFHIWGADLWRGGWCQCDQCRHVPVQAQALRLCNAVAGALAAAGVRCPVYYLAYHDTIDPLGDLVPEPSVWVEFAPRERCYGHALDDPTCGTNRRYAAALEGHIALFDGRVRVFEYYGDAVLFCGCAVPLSAVIDADLAYFARLGVEEVTMLQFGAVSRFAYAVNLAAFAAAALCSDTVGSVATDYCRRFGAAANTVATALLDVEDAMSRVARYGDIRRPPAAGAARERIRRSLIDAIGVLDRVGAVLRGVGGARVRDLSAVLSYTRDVLAGVEAECAGPEGAVRAATLYAAAMEGARRWNPRSAGVWGTVDLPRLHEFYDVIFPRR